eukprot:GHVU01187402.1.p1 GENE.GHVU01187402.1~~GHVU01187402.1.p1  ORF type:complete len:278 (-),score=64.75 GHVU01187402.1:35-748(-)
MATMLKTATPTACVAAATDIAADPFLPAKQPLPVPPPLRPTTTTTTTATTTTAATPLAGVDGQGQLRRRLAGGGASTTTTIVPYAWLRGVPEELAAHARRNFALALLLQEVYDDNYCAEDENEDNDYVIPITAAAAGGGGGGRGRSGTPTTDGLPPPVSFEECATRVAQFLLLSTRPVAFPLSLARLAIHAVVADAAAILRRGRRLLTLVRPSVRTLTHSLTRVCLSVCLSLCHSPD